MVPIAPYHRALKVLNIMAMMGSQADFIIIPHRLSAMGTILLNLAGNYLYFPVHKLNLIRIISKSIFIMPLNLT